MILSQDTIRSISAAAAKHLESRPYLRGVDHSVLCALFRIRGEYRYADWIEEFVARHPDATREELKRIALGDSCYSVRMAIATRESVNDELLSILYTDENPFVRAVVAMRTARKDVLEILAKDPSEWVRTEVAKNWHTPEMDLARLRKDASPRVRFAVYRNPASLEAPYEF